MATFAVLNETIVTNIIVADTLEIAEEVSGFSCVEYSEEKPAIIGHIWNGKKFIDPATIAPAE